MAPRTLSPVSNIVPVPNISPVAMVGTKDSISGKDWSTMFSNAEIIVMNRVSADELREALLVVSVPMTEEMTSSTMPT